MGRWELPGLFAAGAVFFSFVNTALSPYRRFGSVAPDGQCRSPTKNKNARFSAMLAALTPSRPAVTFRAVGPMQVADANFMYLTVLFLHVPAWVVIPGAELPEAPLV